MQPRTHVLLTLFICTQGRLTVTGGPVRLPSRDVTSGRRERVGRLPRYCIGLSPRSLSGDIYLIQEIDLTCLQSNV